MTSSSQWVAICQYNHDSDFEVYVGTYNEVLTAAGQYWKDADLSFDMNHPDKFYVDSKSGYNEDVYINMHPGKRDKDKIAYVCHASGDGRIITIQRTKKAKSKP